MLIRSTAIIIVSAFVACSSASDTPTAYRGAFGENIYFPGGDAGMSFSETNNVPDTPGLPVDAELALDLAEIVGDGVIPASMQPDSQNRTDFNEQVGPAIWSARAGGPTAPGAKAGAKAGIAWPTLPDDLLTHPGLAADFSTSSLPGLSSQIGAAPADEAGSDYYSRVLPLINSGVQVQGVADKGIMNNFDMRIIPLPGAAAMGAMALCGGVFVSRPRRR